MNEKNNIIHYYFFRNSHLSHSHAQSVAFFVKIYIKHLDMLVRSRIWNACARLINFSPSALSLTSLSFTFLKKYKPTHIINMIYPYNQLSNSAISPEEIIHLFCSQVNLLQIGSTKNRNFYWFDWKNSHKSNDNDVHHDVSYMM